MDSLQKKKGNPLQPEIAAVMYNSVLQCILLSFDYVIINIVGQPANINHENMYNYSLYTNDINYNLLAVGQSFKSHYTAL